MSKFINSLNIISILLFSSILVKGQSDFRPGYIIKNNCDTVFTQVDLRGNITMGSICRVNLDNKIREYSPDEIKAYRFINGKYYVSRSMGNKKLFLEYLIKGKVSIYFLSNDNGDHYYIEKDDSILTEIPYKEEIKYVGDKQYLYESKTHIGVLNYFLKDAPEILPEISSIKKPDHHSLIKLVEDYHAAVCNGQKCIIFEKNLPIFKFELEAMVGAVGIRHLKKTYFNGGIIAHIWMPRIDEKYFFKTGIIYSGYQLEGKNTSYCKVPVQLEYRIPSKVIIPVFAYGISIFQPFYQTVTFSGGLNSKLTPAISWSLNYDVDFDPYDMIALIPKSLFSQSITTGLVFEF